MAKCIFCDNELAEDTKPEHILLNSLGGRKTTRRVDCSACNGMFGSTIDDEVGKQVAVLRNALQLNSGTGSPPPMLRHIQSGNDIINLTKDGTPELVAKPFAVRKLEDGCFELQITAKSVEEAAPYIPHIAAQLGCAEEQVLEILKSTAGSYVERRPDTVHHPLEFGGPLAVRSAAKSALVLQIIGRGTRLREDYGKLFFNIIDYTGTATANFADPSFDGEPTTETVTEIGPDGEIRATETEEHPPTEPPDEEPAGEESGPVGPHPSETGEEPPRKFYVDGGNVEIIHHLVYELDTDGKRLTCKALTDWTGEKVRALYPSPAQLRADWMVADKRKAIVEVLAERGIELEMLAADVGRPDDDPFDLLCHLAWNAPLRTRRERAQRMRQERDDFFDQYGPEARAVLEALLQKYADHGAAQFVLPDVLKIPPISDLGNPSELAQRFGGPQQMRIAVDAMASLLYAG